MFGAERLVPPQEQPDSPLAAVGKDRRVALKQPFLERVQGAWFAIYRGGKLVRSTIPDPQVEARKILKSNLHLVSDARPSSEPLASETVPEPGGRIYETYLSLAGPGWSGAVLGVFVPDLDRDAHLQSLDLLRLLLCVLAAPALLMLGRDLLLALSSLRLRLMAVFGVAAFAPLVLLSFLLVRVLEDNHERSQLDGVRQTLAAVGGRLQEQKAQLQASASAWLLTLASEIKSLSKGELPTSELIEKLRPTLETMMKSQLPPEWKGGFSSLAILRPNGAAQLYAPAIGVGARGLCDAELPLRTEPGLHLAWGCLLLGVRAELEIPNLARCALSVGRPIEGSFLQSLSPERSVVLCDAQGFALASASGRGEAMPADTAPDMRTTLMHERRLALAESLERGQPVVREHALGARSALGIYQVLRDLQDTPRALLGVVEPLRQATLRTPFGAVPVRPFLVAIGSCLLLVVVFLSLFVTSRITKPIEALERGAEALRRGDLEVRVATGEGGQIGRLTHSFNQMANELRARMQDLHHLNRGIQDLTSGLDLRDTLTSALQFCARHSPADRVRIVVFDRERGRTELVGEAQQELSPDAPDLSALQRAEGPLGMRLDHPCAKGGELARCFPEHRAWLGVPLLVRPFQVNTLVATVRNLLHVPSNDMQRGA